MIPIYVCEDNPLMLIEITRQIEKILLVEDLDFAITGTYKNPYQLLTDLEQQPQQGIYFLDVDFSDNILNGFELGKRIREFDPRGFIIYVTSFAELLPETFKYRLEALDFIVKEDTEKIQDKIRKSLLEIQGILQRKQPQQQESFTVKTATRILHIPVSTIQYFETTPKKNVINLVTSEELIEFYGTLNEIEQTIGDTFFRSHQSFLVNMQRIKLIDKQTKTIRLDNDVTCLIARGKVKLLQEKMNK